MKTNGLFLAAVLIVALAAAPAAIAQQRSGCFVGRDHLGQPAQVFLQVERYGDWFEISGQLHSGGTGRVHAFKADGHSGAGRLYTRHEYEAGALYIQVLELTETDFIVRVEGTGVFHFHRRPC